VFFVGVCLFVCLLATLHTNFRTDLHEIFRDGWQWDDENWLNFGGHPESRLDTGIVFLIRYHCETEKAGLRCNYDIITSPAP